MKFASGNTFIDLFICCLAACDTQADAFFIWVKFDRIYGVDENHFLILLFFDLSIQYRKFDESCGLLGRDVQLDK